jgi:hypothetical protein
LHAPSDIARLPSINLRKPSMSPRTLIAAACLVLAAGRAVAAEPAQRPPASPDWVQVAAKSPWSPRDSCGELVHGRRMWLLGGWTTSYEDGPRDVWSSADGVAWKRVAEAAPWKHGDLPMSLSFGGRMWLMGGWHGGRLKHASASNQVWSSPDGVRWSQATGSAGWSPRLAAACVAFKDRMWILGGLARYYDGNDADLRNDVWSSADGVQWEQATSQAPWPPRAYHQAVALGSRIWILGGGNYLPGYSAFNDVWSSADGVTWRRDAEHAAWSPRIWFSADVYRDRMWVLGGWSNQPSKNWNDVWHSRDGKAWRRLETKTIWSPRHEQSAYVFDDALWIAGGNAWPLVNDVWRLSLPKDWRREAPPTLRAP